MILTDMKVYRCENSQLRTSNIKKEAKKQVDKKERKIGTSKSSVLI